MSDCSATSECGNGMNSSESSFPRDRGRADVERTAKNERKTQDIVDLVGVIGAAGGDDGVRSRRLGEFRRLFPDRIGEGKNQGTLLAIFGDHFRLQDAAGRQTEKRSAPEIISPNVRADVAWAYFAF